MKDNFSKQADLYAKYRPNYPQELYDYILANCEGRSHAWDCATGNGQVAEVLARYFEQVQATDISEKQLANAAVANNINYSVSKAEKTAFSEDHFDLITVGQALHWFDFELFFKEAKRVLKPNGTLVVWGYDLMLVEPAIDALTLEFDSSVINLYWDEERRHIDDRYEQIHFPFENIVSKEFAIVKHWDLETIEGFLGSWSAVQHFIKRHGYSPVPAFIESLRPHWKQGEQKAIRFPVFLRLMK